jgi:hypothetical protein
MRPVYEDFDEFEFDDAAIVSRVLREQERADRRRASRKASGPKDRDQWNDDDWDDYEDSDDYDDYDDYDNDEFVSLSKSD